jgi:hypothetical protein
MPASSFVSTRPVGLVAGNRFVKSRAIETVPPRDGEKPYEQLVLDTFNGKAEIRMSSRLKLLEEADDRKIRRGDAIDFIDAVQRRNEKKHRVPARSPGKTFALRFAAFAAVYLAVAAAWCLIIRGG